MIKKFVVDIFHGLSFNCHLGKLCKVKGLSICHVLTTYHDRSPKLVFTVGSIPETYEEYLDHDLIENSHFSEIPLTKKLMDKKLSRLFRSVYLGKNNPFVCTLNSFWVYDPMYRPYHGSALVFNLEKGEIEEMHYKPSVLGISLSVRIWLIEKGYGKTTSNSIK